jgi:hypothetical protein
MTRRRAAVMRLLVLLVAGTLASASPAAAQEQCPLSQGYWKTHPQAWPRHSLVLGNPANPAHTYARGGPPEA